MKTIQRVSAVIVIFSSCLFFTNTGSVLASDIPMTIDGVINCAHPDNAITTTCRGEAPPQPVNTPTVPTTTAAPATSSEPTAPQVPMTIDGVINCAHPDNSITTTCWDLAQAAKKTGGSASPSQVDCNLEIYKNYPVCTGIAPQSVIDLEKSKASATPLPETVNCADPMLMQTSACTNRTTTDLAADCALAANKDLPRCQPMTLADGSINCAQPDNAITTTCWEQAAVMKSMGATTAIDCKLPGYSAYPACTGIKPKAVVDFEKAASVNKPIADAAAIIETATAQNVAAEVKISGSVDLKSRSSKTTVLQIDLDLAKAKVKVVATKKGSPTLTQNVSADANGNKTVTFKRNLKGYTIKIIVEGETIDSVKL